MRNPSFADEKMNEKKHNRLALLAVPALLALLMLANGASAVTAVAYPNHSSHLLDSGTLTTFAGSASTLSIGTPLTSLTFGATGTLDPSGGWVNAPMTEVQTDYARAELLTSVTMGSGQQAESEAAVGSFVLLPGTTYQVTADFAMSRAFATCSAVWGDTAIANLRVAGQSIYVTSAPNQVVDVLGVARLVINEQTPTSTGITVNALDLSTVTGVQVLVDSAYSSISCTASTGLGLSQPAVGGNHLQPMDGVPVSGVCTDFTTGGGWIPFPPPSTGTKSTFGLVAGYQSGGTTPTGELEYHDHTSGRFDIHSLDVLYYGCGPKANSRVFGGDAEFDHNSGFCYEAFIQDKGEPGAGSDFFQIFLWPPGTPCGSPPTGSTVTTLTSTNPRAFGHFGQSVTVTGSFAVVGAPQETIVEQSGAGHTYVLGATTGSPSATFTSPFPQSGGHFGFSADISGTRVVVGAPGETASGQFGAGHAYVFNATTGSLIATLTSPNAQSGGEFGFSVAISGTTVVVGAPGETSSGHTQAGNAYIYNATSGSLIATLTSPNAQSGGEFGFSVAISSSGVVVGAPGETAGAGNAYVFSATGGSPTATLTSPNANGQSGGEFGFSVAISSSGVVVGAPGETSSGLTQAGNAYVFDATTGSLIATLTSPNAQSGGEFGFSVAISGTAVVVGAPGETVNGQTAAGHAYVFDATTGSLIATLTSPNAQSGGEFGFSVAISSSGVIVGAPGETSSGLTQAGNAYSFSTAGSTASYTNENTLGGGNIEIQQ